MAEENSIDFKKKENNFTTNFILEETGTNLNAINSDLELMYEKSFKRVETDISNF